MKSANKTELGDPITSVALSLASMPPTRQEPLRAFGTAVMIGPGVAFSAAHVLTDIPPDPTVHPPAEDLLAHIETSVVRGGRDQRPEGDFTGAYGVIAVNFLRSADKATTRVLWDVLKVHMDERTDAAILRMRTNEAPKGYTAYGVALDAGIPAAGTELSAFGYPRHKIAASGDSVEYAIGGETRIGVMAGVEERGVGIPLLHVSFPIDSGMSGGPVIDNSTGRLVGVMSRGTSLGDGGEQYGLVIPTLAFLGLPIGEGRRLLDEARDGRLEVANLDRVVEFPDGVLGVGT